MGLHTLWSLLSLGEIELAKTFWKNTLNQRGWGETEWPLYETIETLWEQGRYLQVADTISKALSAGVGTVHFANYDLILLGFEFAKGVEKLKNTLPYSLPRVLTLTSAENFYISNIFKPMTRLLTLREELQQMRICLQVDKCNANAISKFNRCREDREWILRYRDTLSQHAQQLRINVSEEEGREGKNLLNEALKYCDVEPSRKVFPEINTTLFAEICNAYEKGDLVQLKSIAENAQSVFSTVALKSTWYSENLNRAVEEDVLRRQNSLEWIRNLNQVQDIINYIRNCLDESCHKYNPDVFMLYCDAQAARMERRISQIEQEMCSLKTRNEQGNSAPLTKTLVQGANPAGESANKEVLEESEACNPQKSGASATLQLNHYVLPASASICQIIQRRFDLVKEILNENVIENKAAFTPGELIDGTVYIFGDIECAWCPAGTFVMGSPKTEENRRSDEEQHLVTLSKGFWIACGQTTQSEYVKIIKHNPSGYLTDTAERPVEQVTWYEAVEYCRKLTTLHQSNETIPQGWEWRLPTEAEWEYAARAGTTGATHGELNAIAWNESSSDYLDGTMPVKWLVPNAWGLHDMIGNVYEWCLDIYGEYPIGHTVDPQGPTSGAKRVYRGGSWCCMGNEQIEDIRSAARCAGEPDYPDNYYQVGFRPVLSLTV